MSYSVLVNLRQAFQLAPGFWEVSLSESKNSWCKRVEYLNKTQSNGYSIAGTFITQVDREAYQEPGLYLYCEKKGRKSGHQKRLCVLFALQPDGTVEPIKEIKTTSQEWAIQFWAEIEAYFAQQSNTVEMRRQQLLTEIQQLEFELAQKRAELVALEASQIETQV